MPFPAGFLTAYVISFYLLFKLSEYFCPEIFFLSKYCEVYGVTYDICIVPFIWKALFTLQSTLIYLFICSFVQPLHSLQYLLSTYWNQAAVPDLMVYSDNYK